MGADISRQFQPAQRGTAVGCALAISAFAYFFPDAVGEGGQHMVKFVHLVSCSAWLGVQFWVSFVAGLTKIKLLPRHTFGYVQRHLFGKYYLYGTGFMSVGLATYLMLHPFKDWIGGGNINIQGWSLVLNLASTIVTMLAIEPALNREMDKMHKFEKEHGQGEEIGPITEKKLLENETYKGLRSNFFLWHGVATSVNLIAFTASGVHFWFMSKQINF